MATGPNGAFALFAEQALLRSAAAMNRHIQLQLTGGYGATAWLERKRFPKWRRVVMWKFYRIRRALHV